MDTIFALIALVAVFAVMAIGGGLFAAWFFADEQKMLAPYAPGRVTFKQVLQNFLRDVRELTRPAWLYLLCLWAWWAPRLTNRALLATLFADFAIVASGQDVWVWIASHPLLALAILVMNLLTPLTPPGAPRTIPEPGGLRGAGAEAGAV